MSENKLCPHCGGKMFMATITRACVVEVLNDTENPYKILKEGKDKFDIDILKCARCKESIKEDDLVASVVCKECGRLVTPSDVDENGVCDVCNAMKQRTELANASKEDLVKMLLEAEKRNNPVAAKMVEKQMNASATDKAEDNVPTGITLTPVEETTSEEPVKETEEKPKRRASRRKTTETVDTPAEIPTEETSNANQETPEVAAEVSVAEEAVDNLANQQEAPFPDMNLPEGMMDETPQAVSTETPVEQPVGADFRMFDDSDEAF